MTWVMLIAPGADIDRTWIEEPGSVVCYPAGRNSSVVPQPSEQFSDPELPRTVTVRTFKAPGWRIPLSFALAGKRIPPGYVMPGWVEGRPMDVAPTCTYCWAHRSLWVGPPDPPRDERLDFDRERCPVYRYGTVR